MEIMKMEMEIENGNNENGNNENGN